MLSLAVVFINLIGGIGLSNYINQELTDEQLTIYIGIALIFFVILASLICSKEEKHEGSDKIVNPLKEFYHAVKSMPKAILFACLAYFFLGWLTFLFKSK
jgi:hypothetical protein